MPASPDSELEFSIVLRGLRPSPGWPDRSSLIGKHVEVTPVRGYQRAPPSFSETKPSEDPFMISSSPAPPVHRFHVPRMLLASDAPTRRGSRCGQADLRGHVRQLESAIRGSSFVQGDICDADLVDKAEAEADQVVHFAKTLDQGAADFVRTNVWAPGPAWTRPCATASRS